MYVYYDKNQKENLQLKKGQGHVQNETGISFQFGVGMMRGFREKSLDDGTSRNKEVHRNLGMFWTG